MSFSNSTIDTFCKFFGPYLEWTNVNLHKVHQTIAPDICSYATGEHDGVTKPAQVTSCYLGRITRCKEILHNTADRIHNVCNSTIPGYDKAPSIILGVTIAGTILYSAKKIYDAATAPKTRFTDIFKWGLIGGGAALVAYNHI